MSQLQLVQTSPITEIAAVHESVVRDLAILLLELPEEVARMAIAAALKTVRAVSQ